MGHPNMLDVRSGFLVFLIALPLCLGISMASGFPPAAGLITAMVGGLLSSHLGGAPLTIKGPAAGLIVMVLSAVNELGGGDMVLGYKRCLAVCVMAAVFQILFSQLGAAQVSRFIPPAVVHGMLAAIGLIILSKQIHVLLGVFPVSKTPFQLIQEIPNSLMQANLPIAFVGIGAFFIVFLSSWFSWRIFQLIPPAVFVILMAIPLSLYFHFSNRYLVDLPANWFASITFPDFTILLDPKAWKHVLALSLVASLESLLTVTAMDGISHTRKRSDLNKDLFSCGVGNLVSAFLGGLPMISEVVRSKANLDAGAKTKWSNWFHGLFIFIALTFLTGVIHYIPLSALSAMLIVTGFRLASPKEFYKSYQIGIDQMMVFLTTFLMTIFVDLLFGIFSGLLLNFFIHFYFGTRLLHFYKVEYTKEEKKDEVLIHIKSPLVFSNCFHLNYLLFKYAPKKVIFDLSLCPLVDHTTLVQLSFLEKQHALEIVGFHQHVPLSSHAFATKRLVLK